VGRELADLLTPAEARALRRFVDEARSAYGGGLVEVRLYGRRLRGEGPGIDLFVVVERDEPAPHRALMAVVGEILDDDVVVTPVVWTRARYQALLAQGVVSAVEMAERGIPVS